jgi:hypothetical protein
MEPSAPSDVRFVVLFTRYSHQSSAKKNRAELYKQAPARYNTPKYAVNSRYIFLMHKTGLTL